MSCGGSGEADQGSGDGGSGGSGGASAPWLLCDVDMGLDDARVVLALPMQDMFHVAGIVTVEGSAGAVTGADNALRLLAALGVDSIPVAVGSERTFDGQPTPAPGWRAMAEGLGGLSLEPSSRSPEPTAGADFIAATLRESPEPVYVLAIGPLTNLALALDADPSLVEKIHSVSVLGDFVACEDYNCETDPAAAVAVRASAASLDMLVPSATNKVPFDAAFLARVQGLTGRAGQLVAQMMAQHSNGYMKLWDDSVLEAMLEPSLFTFDPPDAHERQGVDLQADAVEQALLDLWDTPASMMP